MFLKENLDLLFLRHFYLLYLIQSCSYLKSAAIGVITIIETHFEQFNAEETNSKRKHRFSTTCIYVCICTYVESHFIWVPTV